jgi:hypothetical protein
MARTFDSVIDDLKECAESEHDYIEIYSESCRLLLDYIAALEAQLPRWISVEERLPDASERVQAVLGFNIKTRCTEVRLYFDDTKFDGWAVTHWMPLPSAPESEDE